MTSSFSKPATLFWIARNSSAMPPVASLRISVYLPKRLGMPSIANASATGPMGVPIGAATGIAPLCPAGGSGPEGGAGRIGGDDGACDILGKP